MTATQPQTTNTETSTLESMNMATTATQQSHPEISHEASMEALKGMRYVPLPQSVESMSLKEAEARLAKVTESYLEKRGPLAETSQTLDRLRKTHKALQEQGRSAEKAWKQSFMAGLGKQNKSILEQQRQQTESRMKAEQHEEMIRLLEPKVEQMRIHTALARREYLNAHQAAKEIRDYGIIVKSLSALLHGESAEVLHGALDTMFGQAATEVYNNPVYMGQFGVDTSDQPGKRVRFWLNRESTNAVDDEIKRKQLAAVGEIVLKLLPEPQSYEDQDSRDAMPALACEAGPGTIRSAAGVNRRLKELEAQIASSSH